VIENVGFNYDVTITEKEFYEILENIETLLALVQGANNILRHMVEKSPPLFASIITRFITLNQAENVALIEVQKWAIGLTKEMWALKYNKTEGGA
jgi:hypothetical protein